MDTTESYSTSNQLIKGVNLGNWLVLEKWMLESDNPLSNLKGSNELELLKNNSQTVALMIEHHSTYITMDDFRWLEKHGINSVRIPVGYWLFRDLVTIPDDPFEPYHEVYDKGYILLDSAFTWAKSSNITILIDLHGLPGGQNDEDHSGSVFNEFFRRYDHYKDYFIQLVYALHNRYSSYCNYLGISLCNEPQYQNSDHSNDDNNDNDNDNDNDNNNDNNNDNDNNDNDNNNDNNDNEFGAVLQEWIDQFKELDGWIVLPSSWTINDRPTKYDEYYELVNGNHLPLDCHYYFCFNDPAFKLIEAMDAILLRGEEIRKMTRPLIIGEWSLAFQSNLKEKELIAYARAQLIAYSSAIGRYFWSYKCVHEGWSLRKSANILKKVGYLK